MFSLDEATQPKRLKSLKVQWLALYLVPLCFTLLQAEAHKWINY